jgi:hypothetical protein
MIFHEGTQIVTLVDINASNGQMKHKGSVGVIINSPRDTTHSYRVRFPDGVEASIKRADFSIRREALAMNIKQGAQDREHDFSQYVIYRCIVGSRAFGLENEESDTDLRGIFLPPADLHWSLSGVPEQYESQATEECYWELQKFLTLALKANPNVMECLYTPLVEYTSPLAEELLERREIFLSKIFYQTYNGYVLSQFKKLEADLRNKGVIKWKHAMHLIRLLISGTILLNEGVLQVRVNEHRERLLAIRNGQMSWDDIDSWRLELHQESSRIIRITRQRTTSWSEPGEP